MNQRQFRPGLVPIIAFVLVLPGLIALGFWQLDRAQQKLELQQDYDERSRQAPIKLGAKLVNRDDVRFYPVIATGHYDYTHQFLVDNRVLDGKVGYYVITPLAITNSNTMVLVNRGWVLGNPDRSKLPKVSMPLRSFTIKGVAVVPHDKVFQLAEELPIGTQWPEVWQRIDIKRFRSAIKNPVQPVVVLLDPESKAGGLVRNWRRLDAGIAVHQGYAFQWFSLALALAAIFFFVNYRRPRDENGN